jgi:hypothetical protein
MTNQTIQTLAVAILSWVGTNYLDVGTAQNQHGALARVRNGYAVTNTEYVITLPDMSEVRHREAKLGPLVASYRLFPMIDGPEMTQEDFWSKREPTVRMTFFKNGITTTNQTSKTK